MKKGPIYEPRGKAREYSPLALNIYQGCAHGCTYCYAPGCLRMTKEDYFKTPSPRPGIVDALRKQLATGTVPKKQVMLSFVGDPYTPSTDDNRVTRYCLEILLEYDMPVAVLTKGGRRCLRDVDLFKRFGKNIMVGQSLTTTTEESKNWHEPHTRTGVDRLDALDQLHQKGVRTFASFEPVIDSLWSLVLLSETFETDNVDFYKLGGSLNPKENLTEYLSTALRMLRDAGKQIYVKKSLRAQAPGVELRPEETDPDHYNVGGQ